MATERYFAADCPNGHRQVYDKAEICEKAQNFMEKAQNLMDADRQKSYYVVCQAPDEKGHRCGEKFKVFISCEDYK